MRYRLRTQLIVLAIGPPVLALAWRLYSERIPLWVIVVVTVVAALPYLIVATFGYGFGALCYLIGRLPGGNDRKDTKF
jgi:hypothetical protein